MDKIQHLYRFFTVFQMCRSTSYVLVLDQPSDDLRKLTECLSQLCCSTLVLNSADQMMETAHQVIPDLVILAGQHHWSGTLVSQLRSLANTRRATIVALTDCHSPSWTRQENNPGLDGFLVKPLSNEILVSLLQSASVRQSCCSA